MNPKEIRNSMDNFMKKDKKKPSVDEDSDPKESLIYKISLFIGVVITSLITWAAYAQIDNVFGLPQMNILQFISLLWLLSVAGRLLFKS